MDAAPARTITKRTLWTRCAALFALAAAARLAFSAATGEADTLAVTAYEGDAPKWLSYATPGSAGHLAELPFDPPAMVWLARLLTDGGDLRWARLVTLLLGALTAPQVYVVARRELGERVGLLAGAGCALATNLILLSAGLHAEPAYLALALAGVGALQRLRADDAPWWVAAWFGLTQAAACLFRVDHLLFVALGLTWLWRGRGREGFRSVAVAAATTLACLGPYQLDASRRVAQVNERGLAGNPPPTLPLPGALPWAEQALADVRAMPAFAHAMTFRFVDDTVRRRGGQEVRPGDLAVLEEAFGARPEPLGAPLIAMYGPLNFALANHPASDGGFTRAALDDPPPLRAGLVTYPVWLAPLLQPDRPLTFDYPPHLELVNHGYRRGVDRLLDSPSWALQLAAQKIARTASGAATGFGGFAAPVGLSGVRHAVDLVEPQGAAAWPWRIACLLAAAAGLVVAWRRGRARGLAPWLLFLVARAAPAALFFGYARFGALMIPALCVLWALTLDELSARLPPRGRKALAIAALGALFVAESARCIWPPTVSRAARAPAGAARDTQSGRNVPLDVRYAWSADHSAAK